jgi:hypothetical protein
VKRSKQNEPEREERESERRDREREKKVIARYIDR